MSIFLLSILFTILAAMVDILGGVLATAVSLTRRHLEILVALGAGFILAVALLDLIPEVMADSPQAGFVVALGYLTLFLAENAFSRRAHADGEQQAPDVHGHAFVEHPRDEPEGITVTAGMAALLGLTIHAFFDGVAIVSGFEQAVGVGLLIFLAVSLHKLPEGLSLAAIILAAGQPARRALLSTVVLALATVLGGVTVAGLGQMSPQLATGFLAFAAGTFLYVGATDLIPTVNGSATRLSLPLVFVGFTVFVVLSAVVDATG